MHLPNRIGVHATSGSLLLYDFLLILYVPAFLIVHLVFLGALGFRGPGILQGLLFIFSPHPAQGLIARSEGRIAGAKPLDFKALARKLRQTVRSMPPAWISKVRARQAKALAEQLEAETRLMRGASDRVRRREQLNDEKWGTRDDE